MVSHCFPYLAIRVSDICRAISRDPEIYPDPETFNPLRWLKPEFPTYKEPLTQFPTIINSSQFGYGRRLCQGQTVADEDMFIGIGSIAWLFNISKQQQQPQAKPKPSIPKKPTHLTGISRKRTISNEELNAGLQSTDTLSEKASLDLVRPARPPGEHRYDDRGGDDQQQHREPDSPSL